MKEVCLYESDKLITSSVSLFLWLTSTAKMRTPSSKDKGEMKGEKMVVQKVVKIEKIKLVCFVLHCETVNRDKAFCQHISCSLFVSRVKKKKRKKNCNCFLDNS